MSSLKRTGVPVPRVPDVPVNVFRPRRRRWRERGVRAHPARAAYFGASRVVDPGPDIDVDAFVVYAAEEISPRRRCGRRRRWPGRRRGRGWRRGWRSGRRRGCRPLWADSDLHRKAQACARPHAGRRQVVIDHHRRVVAALEQRVVRGARPENRASDISPIRSCVQ